MKILTVENIVNALGANLVNGEDFKEKEIKGVAIDSRKVEKDFLFFALKGDKVDGHDYIKAAFDDGAAAVICERVPEGEEGVCIVVENSLDALKKLASFYRDKLGIKVVGVTGSIGKTTTKEFIATVLSQKYKVFRTEKNQNNLIGLPLSILNIKEDDEVAVLEMGISEFGEMRTLSEIAKPDICVITNISACHLETLGSLDGVFKAKTEIFEHMNPDGYVCVCGDDERLSAINDVKGRKPVTYGFDEKNEIHPVKIINRGLWGSECTIVYGTENIEVSIPLAGKHMICDTLAAISVAKVLELYPKQISDGISKVKALQGRNNLIQKNGITIIDDCYNASPESMKSALDLLTEAITPTVAILGDMFEQGENEKKGHEEIGQYAVDKGINTICCVGTLSKKMYEKAQSEASVKENIDVLYFATVDEAIENLPNFIKKDDTVLIKASNGMKFNRILDAITDDKNKNSFRKREEKLFKNVSSGSEKDFFAQTKEAAGTVETSGNEATEEVKEKTDSNKKSKAKGNAKSADQKEKESAFKQLGIIIGCVILVLIIAVVTFGVVKHNIYKKATEGTIVYITDSKYCTKGFIEDGVIAETSDQIVWNNGNPNVALDFDGKYFYYAVPDGGNYEIFCIEKNAKRSVSVAGNVRRYAVLKKGLIIYISGNGLYTYNAKKDEVNLVDEEVLTYFLNEKKTEVVYYTYSGNICRMKIGKPETLEVLDENVNSLEYVSKDLKNVFYYKIDGFYVKKNDEIILLSSEAKNVYYAEEEKNSTVYYNDSASALWYYNVKEKEPVKVTDDGDNVFGQEFGHAALMSKGKDGNWFYIKNSKQYELKDFTAGQNVKVVGADDKKIYFLSEDASDNSSNIYSVSKKGFGKKRKAKIESSNVDGVEYLEDGIILVTKDDGSGTKDLYSKEKLVARNIQPGSVKKTEYGDDFVFAYQVKDAEGFYKIVLYNGSVIKEIGSSVDNDIVAMSKKKIYFKSKGDNMFDLKYYNGHKAKTYKENVSEFKYIQY